MKYTTRKLFARLMVVAVLFIHGTAAQAVTFDWAFVGDAGNPNDTHGDGYGAVDYEYQISQHEVTNAQYVEFLNDVAASDPYSLYSPIMAASTTGGILQNGSPGNYSYLVKPDAVGQGPGGTDYTYSNKPVNFVSWYDTIRFANWLTSGTTESGTYTITSGGPNAWTVTIPDHSTLPAHSYFLPTEDEWYKAAYYDGVRDYYSDYSTGSNSQPNNNLPSSDSGQSANFRHTDFTTGNASYPMTDVGDYGLSASPYGTFDQGGNLSEWTETWAEIPLFGSLPISRGGHWKINAGAMLATSRVYNQPDLDADLLGFRIAANLTSGTSVPEPSTLVMATLGLLSLALYGWRRRRA